MSLINDMLNDLDARRSQSADAGVNLDWMTGQKETAKNRTYIPLLMGLIFIGLLFTAWQIWALYAGADEPAAADFVVDRIQAASNSHTQSESAHSERSNEAVAIAVTNNKNAVAAPVTISAADNNKKNVEVEENTEANIDDVRAMVETKALVKAPKAKVLKPTEINRQRSQSDKPQQQFVRSLSPEQQDAKVAKVSAQLVRNGQVAEAQRQLVDQIARYALSVRSAEMLATIWLSQQRNEEVKQLLVPLRKSKPRDIGLITIESRLLIAEGQYNTALALLMAQEPSLSDHVGYYELMALAARQSKQYPLSAQVYQGLLENNTRRGDWWAGMAIALEMQSKKTEARSAYQNAVKSPVIPVALKTYAQQRLSVL